MGNSRCYEIYCQIDKRFQSDFRVNNENDKVCKMQFLRFPGRMQETVGQSHGPNVFWFRQSADPSG